MYFVSTRKGTIKELYGKYKVFLLLNEYGDPPFLSQNLTFLKVNIQLAKFGWKSISSSISRELLVKGQKFSKGFLRG